MVTHPHWLHYTPIQTLPQDGEWVEAVELEPLLVPCRMTPRDASQKDVVQTEDGAYVTYSDLLYCPRGIPRAAHGSIVTVYADHGMTEVIGRRTVKRFFNGQLNTRIWV